MTNEESRKSPRKLLTRALAALALIGFYIVTVSGLIGVSATPAMAQRRRGRWRGGGAVFIAPPVVVAPPVYYPVRRRRWRRRRYW